jgi:predicted 3-demethylubiquinone-9 3-methyltransferase (glyoxalase superfamily)
MQKITPSLWFDKNAEESKIVTIKRYPSGITEGPMAGMDGKVLTGIFELEGQRYMCLDGGPIFKFNESVSFMVACQDQAEVDYYWSKLSAVPESEQCGWCKDQFGLSWQIVPENMGELIESPKALQAMLKMHKINIQELKDAA